MAGGDKGGRRRDRDKDGIAKCVPLHAAVDACLAACVLQRYGMSDDSLGRERRLLALKLDTDQTR